MCFRQYEWLIVSYKNNSAHTYTQPPLIQFRFISGADCVDYLMIGALDYYTLGISALSFLVVTLSAKHAGRLIGWARVILLWPCTGTNKGSINCTGPPYWTDSNHKIMWYLGHQCLSGDLKTIVAQDTVSVFRGDCGLLSQMLLLKKKLRDTFFLLFSVLLNLFMCLRWND